MKIQNRQILGDRKWINDCQGLEIRKQGVITDGFGLSSCDDVIYVLQLDSGDDCATFEYAKNHEFYTTEVWILWYVNYISIKI